MKIFSGAMDYLSLPTHTHVGGGEEGSKRGDRAAKGRDTKIEWAAGGGEACR